MSLNSARSPSVPYYAEFDAHDGLADDTEKPEDGGAHDPSQSRPKLLPDKRVYRGGILHSDDAKRAYVHVHCVSPEY